MATSQLAGKWKTAVVAGAAVLAVTGGIAAPASAAPLSGSAGGAQLGEPAQPRDHPGGRPLLRHHWIVRLQYAAVQALNQRTNYSWQRDYKDYTVAIVGNDIRGKRVTVYTKITKLYYGEGGVIGAETAPTSQVLLAKNSIVAQGDVNIITEIVESHVYGTDWRDDFSGECRAQTNLRDAVKAQLACTLG
ncbi:hypothetical protein AB0C76_28190 [Kitasatospora sp. NPDC048722]|uniref:hypothetical protein n=1 Tax=Kitasatospora sp. NPDC048722 TaxID=3155639 RepID=UPI0033CCCD2B